MATFVQLFWFLLLVFLANSENRGAKGEVRHKRHPDPDIGLTTAGSVTTTAIARGGNDEGDDTASNPSDGDEDVPATTTAPGVNRAGEDDDESQNLVEESGFVTTTAMARGGNDEGDDKASNPSDGDEDVPATTTAPGVNRAGEVDDESQNSVEENSSVTTTAMARGGNDEGDDTASNPDGDEDVPATTTAPGVNRVGDSDGDEHVPATTTAPGVNRAGKDDDDEVTTTAEATPSNRHAGDDDDDEDTDDNDGTGVHNTTALPAQYDEIPEKRSSINKVNKGSLAFDRCAVKPFPCAEDSKCRLDDGKVVCYHEEVKVEVSWCGQDSCTRRGTCIPVPGGYRCVCFPGYEGDNCETKVREIADVCKPDPCRGDCHCQPSCQHELGYFCSSKGGFMGKNCTIPVPKVLCGEKSITIDISQDYYTEYDMGMRNTYFYITPESDISRNVDKDCEAFNVGGSFRISVPLPFSACGTKSERGGDAVVVRNKVYVDRRSNLFSMAIPLINFECRYERQYQLVTSLQPVTNEPHTVREYGSFVPEVELCKISACPSSCPQKYSVADGAVYTVGEMIYLRTTAVPKDGFRGYVTAIQRATLSCKREPDPAAAMNLIVDGCPAKTGLHTTEKAGHNACMSFHTPRAIGCTRAYIHLHLMICDPIELMTCEGSNMQMCAPIRDRRSLVSFKRRFETVVGPLFFLNDTAEGEERVDLFPRAVMSGRPLVYKNGLATEDQGKSVAESTSFGRLGLILTIAIPVGVLVIFFLLLLLAWYCAYFDSKGPLRRRRLLSSYSSSPEYLQQGEEVGPPRRCRCGAADCRCKCDGRNCDYSL